MTRKEISAIIGQRIRKCRTDAGLSLDDILLALPSFHSRASLSAIELGKQELYAAQLKEFATFFGRKVDDFLPEVSLISMDELRKKVMEMKIAQRTESLKKRYSQPL